MSEELLVSTKVAAAAMGMGPGSLYRLAKSGAVPSYAVGPKLAGVRFSIAELRETLRRKTKPAATAAA